MSGNNLKFNLETPKNQKVRVSGLSRTNNSKILSITPMKSSTITPQSDGKIKGLYNAHTSEVSKELQRKALSANISRPYNLALSKKVREKMTKKRLDFHIAKDVVTEKNKKHTDDNIMQINSKNRAQENQQDNVNVSSKNIRTENYYTGFEDIQKQMEQRQQHVQRVEDLKKAIETWKTGFCKALTDLHNKFQPHLTKEQILQQLHIDQQMMQYIND